MWQIKLQFVLDFISATKRWNYNIHKSKSKPKCMSAQSSLDKYIKGRRQKNSVQLYRILKGKAKLWLCQVKCPPAAKICKQMQEKKFLSIVQKQLYIHTKQQNSVEIRNAQVGDNNLELLDKAGACCILCKQPNCNSKHCPPETSPPQKPQQWMITEKVRAPL